MPVKLLEVNNFTLSFQNKGTPLKVVENVSFNLNKGETLGIVGESGSGKSMTALSVLNLQPHSASVSGDIYYYQKNNAINLLKLSDKNWLSFRGKNISMIFQEPMTSLNPTMKCGKQVAEILYIHTDLSHDKRYKRVLELFEEVKLPDPQRIYNSYPHEISGGQKQRVMIAMAIALKPSILIADEPTTALDVTVQKAIINLLKDIQEKYAISIIFISHDLGVIAQIAHQVLVMYKGKVVEQGTMKKVLINPEMPYTKGLIKCRPELDFKGERLPILSDFIDKKNETELLDSYEQVDFEKKNQVILSVNALNKRFISKVNFLGKTTLGRIIAQLIDFNSGQIEYKGKSLKKLTNHELKEFRCRVQIIFQDPYSSLNPKLKAGDAITEPLKVHRLYKTAKQR